MIRPLVPEDSLPVRRLVARLVKEADRAGSAGETHPDAGEVDPVARSLLVIGSSTGGPQALHTLIPSLPGDLPVPVVVVQHMPQRFTRTLAERLDREAALRVVEASDGDLLAAGTVLLAPGGHHLVVRAGGTVHLSDDPPVHGVRPAVDVTLASAAEHYGRGVVAVILTGMGTDGANGALAVRRAGGCVLAEAEASCVVYGMPRATLEVAGADRVVPLPRMAQAVVQVVCDGGAQP